MQLVCHDWFEAKRSLGDPDAPNFVNILRAISLGSYVTPQLPLHLYQLVNPRTYNPNPAPRLNSGPPSVAGTGTRTGSLTLTNDESTTGQSTISGLTGTTGLTTKLQRSTLIVNDNPDAHLITLIPFNRRIKDLIGNTTPPNTDSGTPICLSFHAKGGCYSNCRRKANHSQTLNAAEKERLAIYIADRLEKLSKP